MYAKIAGPLVALTIAGAVIADDFLSYDVDADGYLSSEEVSTIEAFDFEAADRNNDGLLDAGEFDTVVARRAVQALDAEPGDVFDADQTPDSSD